MMIRLSLFGSIVPNHPCADDERRRRTEPDVVAVEAALGLSEVAERYLDLDRLRRVQEVSAREAQVAAEPAHDRGQKR
jgi:hypothetical protein